ncbi:TniQ family protein [Pseudomonas aeruginosa]|uniref:TniQ family protein n=1 Tax=Pseudomonas aeruginosa TaxID=287 RepID=UPI000B4CD844|nr:hypothetical protein CD799_33540 [Pseudomonas aeruginosa]
MDRLLLFPEPLPDETLYSLAVRYHRIVANDSYRRTSQELFGTYSRTCGSVLPCCLGPLSAQLGGLYSVGELVESLTLLPLYRPFLKQAAYESAVRRMEGTQGTGLKMSLGITASGLLKYASFRYCGACIEHDLTHYGVPYWHRIHMATGVCVCPHHGNILLSASFPGNSEWRCMLLPGETCGTPVLKESSSEASQAIAEMQFWALRNSLDACGLMREDFLKFRLAQMGMYQRGRLKDLRLRNYLRKRLNRSSRGGEFEAVVGDVSWAVQLFHRRGRVIQPFRYYFMCWLLGVRFEDLQGFVCGVRPGGMKLSLQPGFDIGQPLSWR